MMPTIPAADLQSFSEHLQKSTRILALLGAGLSASSGLPTFRGAGGMWRAFDATALATPGAFDKNPGLVWQFYSYRRHMAMNADPNRAHYALAKLARKKKDFITISQNVDGLSPRAEHPAEQLHLLHGSLFDIRCTSFYCDYSTTDNSTDPLTPALAIPTESAHLDASKDDKTGEEATEKLSKAMPSGHKDQFARKFATEVLKKEVDISDPTVPLASLQVEDLPKCPKCQGLLRPGVVWFGESLPTQALNSIDGWIAAAPKIDLMLVIGTSSKVWPAAGYIHTARDKGARIAVVNMDRKDAPERASGLIGYDWFFEGDASEVVPEILRSVIGDV